MGQLSHGARAAGCRDYAEFRVSSDGEVQGVGLLIAQDPDSHKLMVLAPIPRSPADRAGIQPGDEVSHCMLRALPGLRANHSGGGR